MCKRCNCEVESVGCFCDKVQPKSFPAPEVRPKEPVYEGIDCHPRALYLTTAFPVPF